MDVMLELNQFPFSLISSLMQLIGYKERHGRPTCILYPRLMHPLVSLSVFYPDTCSSQGAQPELQHATGGSESNEKLDPGIASYG
jgi:hypothetical protein